METTTHRTGCLTYVLIAIAAIVLTFASGQVVRPYGGQDCCTPDAGFPLVFIRDQSGGSPLHGIGKIGSEDYFLPDALPLVLNILIYGISLLVIWLCIQSFYYRSTHPHLGFVIPFAWVALMFFIAASFNHRSLPSQRVALPTTTPVPRALTAMMGTWQATNAEGRDTQMVFALDNSVRLITAQGTWRGDYYWREDGVISINVATYADPTDDLALNCEQLLPIFAARCVSSVALGYPAPVTAAPLDVAGYPSPNNAPSTLPMTLHYINNNYQIRVEGNTLVLGTFSGMEQTFVDVP